MPATDRGTYGGMAIIGIEINEKKVSGKAVFCMLLLRDNLFKSNHGTCLGLYIDISNSAVGYSIGCFAFRNIRRVIYFGYTFFTAALS